MSEQFKLPSEQLFQSVGDARGRTLELVADLADEQLIVPKMEIVDPFRWELGHVAFFYDVFLLRVLVADKFLLEGLKTYTTPLKSTTMTGGICFCPLEQKR